MSDLVSCYGKIQFDLENKTKKHLDQFSWKKLAFVMFDDDLAEYYAWFLKKRFNLILNKPLRGPHVSFINDSMKDISQNGLLTNEEVEVLWQTVKNKWEGKEIEIVLNLKPYSNTTHWWLIVDHKHRTQLHSIRAELGLDKPYFGLHMSLGYASEMVNPNLGYGDQRSINHSAYLNDLINKNIIQFD